jgi:hypothetical protein
MSLVVPTESESLVSDGELFWFDTPRSVESNATQSISGV